MKSLEEETKDLQSQDEQVLPFTFLCCPLNCLIFFPHSVPCLWMSYDIMAPCFSPGTNHSENLQYEQ